MNPERNVHLCRCGHPESAHKGATAECPEQYGTYVAATDKEKPA